MGGVKESGARDLRSLSALTRTRARTAAPLLSLQRVVECKVIRNYWRLELFDPVPNRIQSSLSSLDAPITPLDAPLQLVPRKGSLKRKRLSPQYLRLIARQSHPRSNLDPRRSHPQHPQHRLLQPPARIRRNRFEAFQARAGRGSRGGRGESTTLHLACEGLARAVESEGEGLGFRGGGGGGGEGGEEIGAGEEDEEGERT